jgi:hypothetical protein
MIRKLPKKPVKGAVITFRLTPKYKFALELMARRQHRSVTGVVEWAIDQALLADGIARPPAIPEVICLENGAKVDALKFHLSLLDKLWSPSESTRLVNFAKYAPELLSFEEKLIWEKIQDEPFFYMNDELDNVLIKAAWDLLEEYGEGEEFDQEAFTILVEQRLEERKLRARTSKSVIALLFEDDEDEEEEIATKDHKPVKKGPINKPSRTISKPSRTKQ